MLRKPDNSKSYRHQGILECYFNDEIFFLAYLMMAGAFATNQGGLTEWQPYIQWACTSPFAYGNGSDGAPQSGSVSTVMARASPGVR